jgi:hypothetical protein
MEQSVLEMKTELRRMLQEMYPEIRISRCGVAMLAAEIDALEKKCATTRQVIILDDPRRKLS